jgi:hypothetical protein
MERPAPTLMAVTRVRAGREADFEQFVREVISPAVEQERRHLAGMWQTLRPTREPVEDGELAYVFVFYGPATLDDLELTTMFATVYGEQEGTRRYEEFVAMIEDQTLYSFDGQVSSA